MGAGRFRTPSYGKQRKAAGGVLTAKQAPHRPSIAPALGLRAGRVAVAILTQTALEWEMPIMWCTPVPVLALLHVEDP